MNEHNTCPSTVTSRCRIVYRQSRWRVHQFKIVNNGEVICRVVVLRMGESLLLWLGGNNLPEVSEVAVGMPTLDSPASRTGLATTVLGPQGVATAMARRLPMLLKQPVYVFSGSEFDRFTLPLVEHGLITHLKSRPDLF